MATGMKKPHSSYVNRLIGETNMNAKSIYRLYVVCNRCLAAIIYSVFVISAFCWLSGIFNCRLLIVTATMFALLKITGPIGVSSELLHQYLFNGYQDGALSNSAKLTEAISSSKSEEMMELCASPSKEIMEKSNSVSEKKETSVAHDTDMTAKNGSCVDMEQGVDSKKFVVVLIRSLIFHVMLFSCFLPVSAFDWIFKDGFDVEERYAGFIVIFFFCHLPCGAILLLCMAADSYLDTVMEEEARRLEKGKL